MGEGLGWLSEGDLEAVKLAAQAQAAKFEAKQSAPVFEGEVTFGGYVQRAVIKPGGDLEVTIAVPPKDKYQAFSLSDAAGLMLQFTVRRP